MIISILEHKFHREQFDISLTDKEQSLVHTVIRIFYFK
jgi:hypothetical protein